ncbi:helix-turn-helix domain-containing protein [Thomasclavelia cocleata]|uniref:helix-turn-helix domain-containing protein n=1 Tax=Thomasclavelia cocleata TaxID=69824 RepID=UPI0025712E18|nr:helix-turn-helix transcriptional regulator [Thomasclavelia cocleata]
MPQKITLKAARVNAGLTIKEAAKLIGICETTLIRWEKNPSIIQQKYREIITEVYNFPSDLIIFL